MSLRRRTRKKAQPEQYVLDSFSQTWGSTTQWKNGEAHSINIHGSQASGHVPGSASTIRPLSTRTLNWAILNKPLPPLPPEALMLVSPEKSPLRPEPSLANHPALRQQQEVQRDFPRVNPEMHSARPLVPQDHFIQPGSPDLARDDSRHSSTSSEWPVKRRTILGFGKRRPNPISELGIELKPQRPMIDRGIQTSPSLMPSLGAKSSEAKLKATSPSRASPVRSRPKRRTSSSEGRRTPIWSPRAILKIGNPVDYFCLAFAEETAEDKDEDRVDGQFPNYLRQLKHVTPPSPFSRHRGAKVSDKTSSTESVVTHQSRYSSGPTRPGILRRTVSDDPSVISLKSPHINIDDSRPHPKGTASASAVLTTTAKSQGDLPKTPPSPSRPLPLPLQKLTSRSSAPSFRRRLSKSDPANQNSTSPLRQELRHDKTPSPPRSSPPLPTSFKINRPRANKLAAKEQIYGQQAPVTPGIEKEATDLFMYRSPYFVGTPDEFDTPRIVEQNVPEHLAGSPLCPMHPKHKTGGWGICPYHGRRPSLPESISLAESIRSQSSSATIARRTSTITSEAISSRRVSSDSEDDWDERRRSSALDEVMEDARRYGDDNSANPSRPTLGRQDSWNAGISDGAVRGFGFRPPSPDAHTSSTAITPSVPTPDSLPTPGPPRRTPAALGAPEKHRMPFADNSSDGGSESSEAHAHRTDFTHSGPTYLPVDELRVLASRSRAAGKARKEGTINRGGRVGLAMDSSDSVYRYRPT